MLQEAFQVQLLRASRSISSTIYPCFKNHPMYSFSVLQKTFQVQFFHALIKISSTFSLFFNIHLKYSYSVLQKHFKYCYSVLQDAFQLQFIQLRATKTFHVQFISASKNSSSTIFPCLK